MNIKKTLFAIAMSLATLSPLAAVWEKSTKTALEKTMENVTYSWDNGNRYKGQATNDGTLTGLGIHKWPNGEYYIGNRSNNKQDGYGIALVPAGLHINNCDNCMVYVGNFSSDNKSGKGTCYDENGNLIYYGDFSNNKPIDDYPSTSSYPSYKFKTIEYTNGNKYIGETKDGKRHGYGIYVWESGDTWFGNWENDGRKGKGIYLWHKGKKWQTENCDGDDCSKIASSSDNSDNNSNYSGGNNSGIYSLSCTNCFGTGRSQCVYCSGTGQQLSSGIVGYDYYGYPRYGMTYVTCGLCFGTGRTVCSVCGGLGKMTFIPSAVPVPTTPLYGNDYIGSGSGGGGSGGGGSGKRSYSSDGSTCSSCKGTGLCSGCKGSPTTICNYCDGVGKKKYSSNPNANYETCAVCNGSGKKYCPICRGTGRCLTCHGAGKIR